MLPKALLAQVDNVFFEDVDAYPTDVHLNQSAHFGEAPQGKRGNCMFLYLPQLQVSIPLPGDVSMRQPIRI